MTEQASGARGVALTGKFQTLARLAEVVFDRVA
jgi:hypothetical protein